MTEAKTPKKTVDWELVEKHYRAGLLSLREIGAEYGVSHVAIGKQAKKFGWTRDLSQKIEQKARELVTKDQVTKAGYQEEKSGNQAKLTDAAVVDVIAQKVAEVDIQGREDLRLVLETQRGLASEVAMLSRPELMEHLEEMAEIYDKSGPDSSGRWKTDKDNELYRYIISLAGRIKMMKDLASAHGVYIPMQRKIFGLDAEKQQTSEIDEVLKKLAAERRGA